MLSVKNMETKIPDLLEWIAGLKRAYAAETVTVASFGFAGLSAVYPASLLDRARAVVTAEPFPYPPLDALGFPELAYWNGVDLAGINYAGLIFVRKEAATQSLFFHELVHVVQGDALGQANYLLAYAASLATDAYEGNPFEETAYRLQGSFEEGNLGGDTVELIEREARDAYVRILGEGGTPA